MSKLSLGKGLFNLEENIKDDAMRPTILVMTLVLFFMVILIIGCNNEIIKYLSFLLIIGIIVFTLYTNYYLLKNDPDRLQTEKYLIHKQLIEAQMLENKNGTINGETVKANVPYLLTDEGDING